MDDYLISGYKSGDLTLDDMRRNMDSKGLLFYIFFDISDDSYEYNPEFEYQTLESAVKELISLYSSQYKQDIFVDMHIYYVDKEMIEYSKEYFKTHVLADYEYNCHVSPGNRIILEMGAVNEYSSENLRYTYEEYYSERERIRKWQQK